MLIRTFIPVLFGRLHRRTLGWFIGFVLATSVASPAAMAQPLPGLMPRGVIPDQLKTVTTKTKVGSWAQYSVLHKAQRQKYTWKVALVGKVGKNKFWWEYYLSWGRLRSLIIKILVRGPRHDPQNVERIIWKPAGHQAVEVPVKKGRKLLDMYVLRPKQRGRLVGRRQLKVVAGLFHTHYFLTKNRAGQDSHFWVSQQVPILGLVKLLSPTVRMELIGYGSRARSMIRGKPGKLPGVKL